MGCSMWDLLSILRGTSGGTAAYVGYAEVTRTPEESYDINHYVGLPRKLRTVVGTMLPVAMFCCLSARDSAFSGETAQSGGHMR